MTKPYDLVKRDGKTVDALTDRALKAAEKILGYDLTIVQGSYNAGGVGASAGTHDGGGVVDLLPWDWQRKVRALRRVGFAAWHRTPAQGPWGEHIHAVLIGNTKLSPSAQRQVTAYLAGRNGLANNGKDDGPREYVGNRFRWPTAGNADTVLTAAIKGSKANAGAPKRAAIFDRIAKLARRLGGTTKEK